MNSDVGMHHAKNSGQGNPFSNTIKDTIAQSCITLCLNIMYGGVTHDCASILDSIGKKTSCFHYFSHGASLHHCSFSRMIFTLV